VALTLQPAYFVGQRGAVGHDFVGVEPRDGDRLAGRDDDPHPGTSRRRDERFPVGIEDDLDAGNGDDDVGVPER
jgi:hypothetical protein